MKKRDANALRRIAADVLDKVVGEQGLADEQRHDYLVSIVRQWQTYDGSAELYLPGKVLPFRLTATPAGWNVSGEPQPDWLEAKLRSWSVPPGSLADVMAQLNRGQSAEVVTADGTLLRLWTDPRKQEHGVEPLLDESAPGPPADGILDVGELAARHLEYRLGAAPDADERAVLVEALVRQWKHYRGQACLFVGDDVQFVLVRRTDPFGLGFHVASTQVPFPIAHALADLGFPAEAVPEVLRRLNFSEEVEYQDERGEPWLLWYDVPERRLRCRPRDAVPGAPAAAAPPTRRSGRPSPWARSRSHRGRLPLWPRRARLSLPTCAGTPLATGAT